MKGVTFIAEVTGDSPPFKWRLWKTDKGSSTRCAVMFEGKTVMGEADTKAQALWEARDAAADAYTRWAHENTKEFVPVLERELQDPDAEAPVQPESERRPLNPVTDRPEPVEFMD